MRPVMQIRELAALLGLPEDTVWNKLFSLGLRKEKPVKQTAPKPPKKAKAPKASKPPPVRALKESAAKPKLLTQPKGPPPMTAAQREAHEKLRITYAPGAMPWKARVMFAPMAGIPDLSYRGQAARG